MSVIGFEGPAGTGKTTSLMNELIEGLRNNPLSPQERVLALTFMHGARRRLDSRLREIEELHGRFHATTVDSFAWRLVQRWRGLVTSLGYELPAEEEYDETCALAAALMARPAVRTWIAMSYPLVLVDEAQDLSSERSTMIAEAAKACCVLLAFDEFQCLDPGLRPMAIESWLPNVCTPHRLTECRRTDEAELLEAARAVKDGRAVSQTGKRFKVMVTPGKPHFAATCLANAIAWRKEGGRVAILTPSRRQGFADRVVELVCSGSLGKHQNGPFPIQWESSDEQERKSLWQKLEMPDVCPVPEALSLLGAHLSEPAVKSVKAWIERQSRVLGIDRVTATQVQRQINRALAARRRYGGIEGSQFAAMTIQQAKNREFEHVVVIWPYTIPNDDEQKRRLLYNAVTRAQRSCLVLVQAQELLDAPPFVPSSE